MEYDKQIKNKITLLNEILIYLGKPSLFKNQDFLIGELSGEFYLVIELSNLDKNIIPMEIRISKYDLQIGMDRVSEVFEWSNDFIENSRNDVTKIVMQLLTSNIMVEYCGSNYTCFNVFNKDGQLLFKTPIISGFYLKFNCQKRKYFPVYEV